MCRTKRIYFYSIFSSPSTWSRIDFAIKRLVHNKHVVWFIIIVFLFLSIHHTSFQLFCLNFFDTSINFTLVIYHWTRPYFIVVLLKFSFECDMALRVSIITFLLAGSGKVDNHFPRGQQPFDTFTVFITAWKKKNFISLGCNLRIQFWSDSVVFSPILC